MATVIETHPNQVSASLAWGAISGKIRNGYKVVEVRAKVVDGKSVWELRSSTDDPPTTSTSTAADGSGG